jgi:hypothetical protein
MSLCKLNLISLLAVSPSSTAVKRGAVYGISLQLHVMSRWPETMARTTNEPLPRVAAVLFFSLAVQYVWLCCMDHGHAWLLYQFYTWVWLWS